MSEQAEVRTYTLEAPPGGWREINSFTEEEKIRFRPMAETLAMLDDNGFFDIPYDDNLWYVQYLPEAFHLYEFTGNMYLRPMYGERFVDVFTNQLTDFDRIRAGALTDDERKVYPLGLVDWLRDDGVPPNPDHYMPDWPDEELTHYMMYQTTSEGTPISPAFATPEELARWLADTNASIFAEDTASYEVWLRIAKGGYAPSVIIRGM